MCGGRLATLTWHTGAESQGGDGGYVVTVHFSNRVFFSSCLVHTSPQALFQTWFIGLMIDNHHKIAKGRQQHGVCQVG